MPETDCCCGGTVAPGAFEIVSSEPAKTVAIIENDPNMRRAITRFLSSFGYVTQTYDCAETFLAVAATSKADCLLVDIELVDISGIEMARRLASNGLTLPIIFMSGLDDESIRCQATELGCIAYLQKPFTEAQLIVPIFKAIGLAQAGYPPS